MNIHFFTNCSSEWKWNLTVWNVNVIFRYEYELVVVQGLVLNDSVTPIIRRTAKEPPLTLSPDELGGKAANRHVFTMGVRLKSPEVSISDSGIDKFKHFRLFCCIRDSIR